MSDIALSPGVRSNLLALQNTASLMQRTQGRLATGKKVNSALDNPTNFFTSAAGVKRRGGEEVSGIVKRAVNLFAGRQPALGPLHQARGVLQGEQIRANAGRKCDVRHETNSDGSTADRIRSPVWAIMIR